MLAYLSQDADKRIFEALASEGIQVHPLAPFGALAHPTHTHADMLLLSVGGIIFKHADYFCAGESFLNVGEHIGEKYPEDVLLNIAVVGTHVFCNTKYASRTVLEYIDANGFEVHHVAQGYAHCSTCIVSENAIITADEGIAKAAISVGIDVLLIEAGHISLPPYGYGFIGGASGTCGESVYFCGSLKYHPDGDRIGQFIEKNGKRTVELLDAPLCDVGGILFI